LRVNVADTNSNYSLPSLSIIAASVNSANNVADADTAEMRACQGASFCTFTHTYVMRIKGQTHTVTTLPAFFNSISGKTVTIAPTDNTQMGTFQIEMIQTPNHGTQASYTFDSLTLTVGCIISSVANFVVPTLADRTYVLYSPTKKIDMATYDSSNMIQTPNCGFTLVVSYAYTIDSAATTFISVDGTKPSQLNIMTNNPVHV